MRTKSCLLVAAILFATIQVAYAEPTAQQYYEGGKALGVGIGRLALLLLLYAGLRWIRRVNGSTSNWPLWVTIVAGVALAAASEIRRPAAPRPGSATAAAANVDTPVSVKELMKNLDWMVVTAPPKSTLWNVAARPGKDKALYALKINSGLLPVFENFFRKSDRIRFAVEGVPNDEVSLTKSGTLIDRFKRCVEMINRASPEASAAVQSARPNPADPANAASDLGKCAQFNEKYAGAKDLPPGSAELEQVWPRIAQSQDLRPFMEATLRDKQIQTNPHNPALLTGAVTIQCKQIPTLHLNDAVTWDADYLDSLRAYSTDR